jgi:hypothetical protein
MSEAPERRVTGGGLCKSGGAGASKWAWITPAHYEEVLLTSVAGAIDDQRRRTPVIGCGQWHLF